MNVVYDFNEGFFDIQTKESIYVLGLLAADGTISYNKNEKYEMRIEIKDKDLLERVKTVMQSNHPLHYYLRLKEGVLSETWVLSIRSKEMVERIIELGITPKNINEDLIPYFILGFFDGDGSVYFSKDNTLIRSKVISASESFIKQIAEILNKEIGISVSVFSYKEKYYSVHYGAKDTLLLYDYLYRSNPPIFLERKKLVFDLFIEKRGKNIDLIECQNCGIIFERNSNRQKWCHECKPLIRQQQWRTSGQRKREKRLQKRIREDAQGQEFIICAFCGGPGIKTNPRKKYCSTDCKNEVDKIRRRKITYV
jgi:intein-encoded DNA endonuclease-like protein